MRSRKVAVLAFALFARFSNATNVEYVGIGGGYQPTGSQIVLEKNLQLFQQLITLNTNPNTNSVETRYLFGGGDDPKILDVVELDPSWSIEERLFATMFEGRDNSDSRLRHNQIAGLAGSASRANVKDAIEDVTADQYRLYFTGHGSPGGEADSDPDYTKNVMDLWNSESIQVRDFVTALDQAPKTTEAQIVMVQCYSGGFAQINYEGGDPKGKLSTANRCGFFSQVPDRYASGCTPDVKIRQEYSPFFFAALSGRDESGAPVDADYDHDGKVTPAEAHAYVIIHENAIDIPITTSTALLRSAQSTDVPAKYKAETWGFFGNRMTPAEKAIAKELGQKLGIDLTQEHKPYRVVEAGLQAALDRAKTAKDSEEKAQTYLDSVWKPIRLSLIDRFPIFENVFGATNGLSRLTDSQEVAQAKLAMTSNPDYQEFTKAFQFREEAKDHQAYWDRDAVKWERLKYLLESKIFEAKLLQEGAKEAQDKYMQLLKCESDPFFIR